MITMLFTNPFKVLILRYLLYSPRIELYYININKYRSIRQTDRHTLSLTSKQLT